MSHKLYLANLFNKLEYYLISYLQPLNPTVLD